MFSITGYASKNGVIKMGLDVTTNKSVIIKCSVCDEDQVYVYISTLSIKFEVIFKLDSNDSNSRTKNCFEMIFGSDFY